MALSHSGSTVKEKVGNYPSSPQLDTSDASSMALPLTSQKIPLRMILQTNLKYIEMQLKNSEVTGLALGHKNL